MAGKTPVTVKVTLITGILSLLTASVVAVIQSYAPSNKDLETLVRQINDNVLPRIEQKINMLDIRYDYILKELSKTKERLARLEERSGIKRNFVIHKRDKAPKKPEKLPRLQLQQRTAK